MDLRQWLTLVTCAGLLGLAFFSIQRFRANPLAGPLTALCLISFTWNMAVWAHSLTGVEAWLYIDRTASPWTAPAAVRFVITFVGIRRRIGRRVYIADSAFVVLSAIAASGFFTEWGRRAALSPAWDHALAAAIVAYLIGCGVLLARHLLQEQSAEEKMRTRLMVAATVIGAILAIVELLLHDYIVIPSMLITLVLLAAGAFRLRVFASELISLLTLYSIALAVIAGGSYIIAIRTLASHGVLMALTVLAVTACWVALMVQSIRAAVEQRTRMQRLAILGKLAAQMAHDLKNPLAAIKGAAQYLAEERARGRTIDNQGTFLDLLVSESERLSRLIDKYQRLGRMESLRTPTAVNDLVERVLQVHRMAVGRPVATKLELAQHLPDCPIDADLTATAIENVLRNATEAMKDGGVLTVRTEALNGTTAPASIAITIEDSGHGMDPRELERAFDEFFTTKPTGSGLGLPLVKRVVEAHGGSVSITSIVGRGTKVSLHFPIG